MDDLMVVLDDLALMPVRAHAGDAGADLRAALDKAQAIARNLSRDVRRAFEDGMNGDRRRCG